MEKNMKLTVASKAKESNASKTATKEKFLTKILQSCKTATGIKVPEEIVESLGTARKPPVLVTINNCTYRMPCLLWVENLWWSEYGTS